MSATILPGRKYSPAALRRGLPRDSHRWWPPALAAGLLVLALGTPCRAAKGDKASDQKVSDLVKTVINRGADIYNNLGDARGCYRFYQGSMLSVRALLQGHPDLQKLIDAGLADAERAASPYQSALILNQTLHKIYNHYNPKAAVAKATNDREGERPAARPGQPVARSVSTQGLFLRREALGKPWHFVGPKEAIYPNDLLLGAEGAVLESADGAVRLDVMSDLNRNSPFPIRESAVILHTNPKADLDFTLDRGRVDVVNTRKKGPAHVRVRVRKDTWDLTLAGPGASIAMEVYGRWPAGVPFKPEPGPEDAPIANLVFLVEKGQVTLSHNGKEHLLSAPPGPALIEWDSVDGMDDTPHRLEKLPAWSREGEEDSPLAKKKKAAGEHLRQVIRQGKSLQAALEEFVQSDNPEERSLAVFAMGALDDLKGLARAVQETKHRDVWEDAVLALRHWIGRGPGQDQLLYQGLLKSGRFTKVDAASVLELLHSFGDEDLADPARYQMLIDYLDHDKLAIRGLSYWHLSRLVPAGEKFGYSPLDPEEKRTKAIQKWRQLIPNGKLPPRPQEARK